MNENTKLISIMIITIMVSVSLSFLLIPTKLGPQGLQGLSIVGPVGPTGPQGLIGIQGPQGIQGEQGESEVIWVVLDGWVETWKLTSENITDVFGRSIVPGISQTFKVVVSEPIGVFDICAKKKGGMAGIRVVVTSKLNPNSHNVVQGLFEMQAGGEVSGKLFVTGPATYMVEIDAAYQDYFKITLLQPTP